MGDMSRRQDQIVLLCEDTQHEAFVRRFLERRGWRHKPRVLKSSTGAGEQFVREHFPTELRAIRHRHVDRAQIVVIDGDNRGPAGRIAQLDAACQARDIKPRQQHERVAFVVPTWNIETWLAYLDGETVDARRSDYPRLERERDCSRHGTALIKMCDEGVLRSPAPSSLKQTCEEFRNRLDRDEP